MSILSRISLDEFSTIRLSNHSSVIDHKLFFTNLKILNTFSFVVVETVDVYAKRYNSLVNSITVFNLLFDSIVDFNVLLESLSVLSLIIFISHRIPSKSVTLDISEPGGNKEKAFFISSNVKVDFNGTD
jgi:hypothetical protein